MKLTPYEKQTALLQMVFAAAIWGFAFVATVWALQTIESGWLTFIRFSVAAVVIDLCLRFFGKRPKYSWKEAKISMIPGLCLFLMLFLQTWGLEYTSPTRSGFITTLYVLLIPFFERYFQNRSFRKILFFWIGFALIGTALICQLMLDSSHFNKGDLLTLLCAIAGAAHFVAVSKNVNKVDSPERFHLYQCIWIALFSLIPALFLEDYHQLAKLAHAPTEALFGIFWLCVVSSALAFLIQVRSQRILSASTVGLLGLLESPFAALFSVFILGEHLTSMQLFGACMILMAATAESLSQGAVSPTQQPEIFFD